MKKSETPVVSICCLTYNHERFIRQCLDGFLMQKTSFPFEILIHDDASTDSTASVIREYEERYPGIIKPIYQKENQYKKGIANTPTYQFPRVRGKYIAFCEGDDYWIDEYKLQKQVDFLESHPDYSLCSHRFKIYDKEENVWEPEWKYYKEIFAGNPDGVSFSLEENFLRHWLTKVLTVVVRKDSIVHVDFLPFTYFRDVHLFYYALKGSKGFCLNFFGGVYNRHFGGVYGKVTNKVNSDYRVYKDLLAKNKSDAVLKKIFRAAVIKKVYADVLDPEISLKYTLKIAFESIVYSGDIKTSVHAFRRIFRDRLWRIKRFIIRFVK
ncbi:glycosyltransferase family 2 protein [Dysgonomonas hofstadii]|nr:glycosyltransferase [Dysgonomonas hofstadii]